MAKIISAFPGTGKTYFKDKMDNDPFKVVSDSDSSGFSWMQSEFGKVRNPEFPGNYIEHIKKLLDKTTYILVSSHKDVRDALVDSNLDFVLVYPKRELKVEYLTRYEERGSPLSFIVLVDKMWDIWISELEQQAYCWPIQLSKGEYLSDIIHLL